MGDKLLPIMGWSIVIAAFVILHLMDRRIRTRGALFTGPSTPPMRLFALLLGIVFAIIVFNNFQIELLILAIALIGYGLGMGGLLNKLQANDTTAAAPAPKTVSRKRVPAPPAARPGPTIGRTLSFLVRLVLILAVVGAAIYGALWVSVHPGEEEPVLSIFIIGFLVLTLVGIVRGWKSIEDLINRLFD